MPNWCKCNLQIQSTVEDKKQILNSITIRRKTGDTVNKEITFEKILKTPKKLLEENKHLPLIDDEPRKDLIEKYGADNWYDWRIKNWGVKWDASEPEFEIDDTIDVSFQTPWGPPYKILKKLSELHPKARLVLQFSDEFSLNDPQGEITYQDGRATQLRWNPERNNKSQYERDHESTWDQIWSCIWVRDWTETIENPEGWE